MKSGVSYILAVSINKSSLQLYEELAKTFSDKNIRSLSVKVLNNFDDGNDYKWISLPLDEISRIEYE
jgi:hypothetical protein